MPSSNRSRVIYDLIKDLNSLDPLKQLFWTELNYERVNHPLSRQWWSDTATKSLAEAPILFAAGGHDNDFHIIYSRLNSDRLLRTLERPVVQQLLRDHPYSMFILSNRNNDRWHFLNVKYNDDTEKRRLFRRISIGPEESLRTATDRIALLDLETLDMNLSELPALEIQERHDHAFDVEAVTKQFFEDYKQIFYKIQRHLTKSTNDPQWAHDYSLQFLNRIMFLYFIQRKRWLNEDPDFVRNFWITYKNSQQPQDTFFENWISVLFFEAFNNQFQAGRADRQHLPQELRQAFSMAPFLNGGLFKPNQLDDDYDVRINDDIFETLFDRFNHSSPGFLERYNFTIAESTPFDVEVAVDPEMIGKVYESLVNITFEGIQEEDHRGSAGIFYTPRVEIDLMCRLSLVDWLTNVLGDEHKSLLYQAVFAYEPEEKREADEAVTRANLWEKLHDFLNEITVCDPACGSGSFLVGMLTILDDLQERANHLLGHEETAYDRRKRIIGQSLYGVDVMDWAVHVAELRLWLQLVIETELEPALLHLHPLLPNLSFKVRQGDSLVQEVGGINFGLHRERFDILTALRGKLTKLKGDKLHYYYGETPGLSKNILKQQELNLFREILQEKVLGIDKEIKRLNRQLETPPDQLTLPGIKKVPPKQLNLLMEQAKKDRELKMAENSRARDALTALKTIQNVPFVWDISFVEIFEGQKKGFDIVIGNPPYVRQEKIGDPQEKYENKVYKTKLQESLLNAYPHFFNSRKPDGKSDLYIYFYLHGLSLLNQNGSFCFITSNSWLDVGYGKQLQEFLLNYCHVKFILDNQLKRSFATADINTIIALFSAPLERPKLRKMALSRFVMFKAPFDQVLLPVIFEELETSADRKTTPEYRLFPITQEKLFQEGIEPQETEANGDGKPKKPIGPLIKSAKYIGNKWGGKYLRAPDIYWTILEKGKGKLVRLGDIAEVRRGITTGANEFFYLDNDRIRQWGIEEEFLKPVIKSPRECKRILIDPDDLRYKIFMCHKEKEELKGTAALEYIQWGEKQEFNNRPSCRGRKRWWNLGKRRTAPIISPSSVSELPRFFQNHDVLADKRLYEIYPQDSQKTDALLCSLNSTLSSMFMELGSRTGLGEGLLDLTVYELADLVVINPQLIDLNNELFEKYKLAYQTSLRKEVHSELRRSIDNIIFNVIGLTTTEEEDLYEAIINLVESRITKAVSF